MRYASITDRLTDLGSEKWALHLTARQMKAAGEDIIELTIGEPDVAPDQQLLDEANRAMRAGRTRYSNGRGEPSVLKALADKYAKRRADTTTDNIMVFPGTQTALFAVMLGLVEKGDGVLVGDPLYATYEGVIAAAGAHPVYVPMHADKGFHMQAADLEKAITPECKVLLLNSPHNPTGAVLSKEELRAIGDVCIRHDLWIVSDEVYEQLVYQGEFASPFDRPELAERTIVVSSISKSHAAPGFRSGWAVGPKEFCERLLPVSETMLFGVQPFIADMTALAVSGTFTTSAVMREFYTRRAGIILETLGHHASLRVLPLEAGMFQLLDISKTGMSGEDFAWALLREHKVAVMPGSSFGQQAKNLVRLSLTVPDELLKEACKRIAVLAEELEGRQAAE
jgi:arginine:pyruvate transaminase